MFSQPDDDDDGGGGGGCGGVGGNGSSSSRCSAILFVYFNIYEFYESACVKCRWIINYQRIGQRTFMAVQFQFDCLLLASTMPLSSSSSSSSPSFASSLLLAMTWSSQWSWSGGAVSAEWQSAVKNCVSKWCCLCATDASDSAPLRYFAANNRAHRRALQGVLLLVLDKRGGQDTSRLVCLRIRRPILPGCCFCC